MSVKITVVGLGGAGSAMVAAGAGGLPECANAAALDTDANSLETCGVSVKLQVGVSRTRGLGCGGESGVGRLAAEDDLDNIRELFGDRQLVLVACGLGGGTGTGGASAVLRAAREAGALTIAMTTLPFDFEGGQRAEVARQALRGIREAADALIVVPNERLLETVAEDKLKGVFDQANAILGASLSTIVNLIARPGYINLDFADLQAMLTQSDGTCALGYGEADGRGCASKAVEALLSGPMLDAGRLIENAEALLIGIVGGEGLAVSDVGEIMHALEARRKPGCRLCMGTYIAPEMKRKVILVALAAETWSMPRVEEKVVAPKRATRRRGGRRKQEVPEDRQPLLGLELGLDGRGRFKNIDPTIIDGEDLDIPTFVRMGVSIDK